MSKEQYKKGRIIVCCECNNVIKSQAWRFGDCIDVYCTRKCLMKNQYVNRVSIDKLIDDDAVMIYQEMLQE